MTYIYIKVKCWILKGNQEEILKCKTQKALQEIWKKKKKKKKNNSPGVSEKFKNKSVD